MIEIEQRSKELIDKAFQKLRSAEGAFDLISVSIIDILAGLFHDFKFVSHSANVLSGHDNLSFEMRIIYSGC